MSIPIVSVPDTDITTSNSWNVQMDAIVSDLSMALEESQQLQRRRRPCRRRTNKTGMAINVFVTILEYLGYLASYY